MKRIIILLLMLQSSLIYCQNIKENSDAIDITEKQKKKLIAKADEYQRGFLETIRTIIHSRDNEELYISKSYFSTLFETQNSLIFDVLNGTNTASYTAFQYRETLSSTEMNSPIFNKDFKMDDTLYVSNGRDRTLIDIGQTFKSYVLTAYFIERLSSSNTLNETDLNPPTFNAYRKEILKEIEFRIFLDQRRTYIVRISGVKIISENDKKYKLHAKRILDSDTEWLSKQERDFRNQYEGLQEDISISSIDSIYTPDIVLLEAYPKPGEWDGKGVIPNSQQFDPMKAYDISKGGDQIVTLQYSFVYADGNKKFKETSVFLSRSLAPKKELVKITEQEKFNPNTISLEDFKELGLTDKSIEKIKCCREKCKWIFKSNDLYKLLNKNDKITLNNKSYDYYDLEQTLRQILIYDRPVFQTAFDPNNLDSIKLTDAGVDPYTISEFKIFMNENNKVRSRKQFMDIGCFDNYQIELRGKIAFSKNNHSPPTLVWNDAIPGFGHMKFKSSENEESNFCRKFRTGFYTIGFWSSVSYSIVNGVQSWDKYKKHKSSEIFRISNKNYNEVNKFYKRFIYGGVSATVFLVGNFIHLKLLERSNKNSMDSDPVERWSYIKISTSSDGISLTYTF